MRDFAGRVLVQSSRACAVLVLLAMLAPFAYAVWMSFAPGELLELPTREWSLRWYREFLNSPRWTRALATTGEVALLSVAMSVVAGLGLAVAATRFHFRGERLLSGAVLLPMFVPTVVLGMGLLPLIRLTGLWGTTAAVAAAHSLVSLPVVFLLLRSALTQTCPDLERAARGLGAGPWAAFRRVTLPLIAPAVLAGAVVALILSANEFILAVFLTTPRTKTLPAALWPESRDKETPLLAAASCLTVLVTVLGLWLAWRLMRRR
jgi:ABC-type spermidine/putrescine transport system permease subunit II